MQLILRSAAFAVALLGTGTATAAPAMTVWKDANCGCCAAWVKHARSAGFDVTVVNHDDMPAIKAMHDVPANLQSCHTAEIAGYVVEGHVPAAPIKAMLAKSPEIAGIAVPGMPAGSPGMESPSPEPFAVVLWTEDGRKGIVTRYGVRQ